MNQGVSRRFGFDGWALKPVDAARPMWWTASTTRKEARELKETLERNKPDLFIKLKVVKVKIAVTEVSK